MTGNILLLTIVFLPLAAAPVAYAIGNKNERLRDIFVISAVALNFLLCLLMIWRFVGAELRLMEIGGIAFHFRADGFRLLYGSLTAFLWLVTCLFSPEYFSHSHKRNRYYLFNLLTFGSVLGVFFAADLRTMFLFFEVMSFTSYALVAHDESPKSLKAAETFLAVAIIGGLCVLMGMIMLYNRIGTLEFAKIHAIASKMKDKSIFYLPGVLLLIGFGGKAGMFPLHIWLPKAHPVAPAPASALLSGILTKTGVFGVAILSYCIFFGDYAWGTALIILSSITMLLGATLGVFSNDLKRTLACSSVSQIGFVITGVAMQVLLGSYSNLAARGAVLHMVNHSLLKLILFVAAGIVYLNRHELSLDKIRGFGRGKPLFFFVFLMATLGITGLPFWNGYVSKSLLNASITTGIGIYDGHYLETLLYVVDKVFNFTGLLTIAYMTKLFVCLFIDRGETVEEKGQPYMSRPFSVVLVLSALILPVLGSFPNLMEAIAKFGQGDFHALVPKGYAISYLALYKMPGKLLTFGIGVAIYVYLVRGLMMWRKDAEGKPIIVYSDLWPAKLDLETLIYRPALGAVVRAAGWFASIMSPFIEKIALPINHLLVNGAFYASNAIEGVMHPINAIAKISKRYAEFLQYQMNNVTRRRKELWEDYTAIGDFTLNLLLAGIGLCIALVYVYVQAFTR